MGIQHTTFYDVAPDPTLGMCQRRRSTDDAHSRRTVIIALGGGSAMDAGKIMWVLYEHPEVDFMDMAMRFVDIRKRVYTFPKMGEKAYFVAIPTSAGTGSEVTPFAVITDEKTGVKYPLGRLSSFCRTWRSSTRTMHMTAPKGLDRCIRYRRCHPRAGSVRFDDGDRLYRRSCIQALLRISSNICRALMTTARTIR